MRHRPLNKIGNGLWRCWHVVVGRRLHLRARWWRRRSANGPTRKSMAVLRRRKRVSGWRRRRLLRSMLRREAGRDRRLALVFHMYLHVRRRRRVGKLVVARRHVGCILGVVDGRLRDICIAVDHGTVGRPVWANLGCHELRAHPSHVVAGTWTRPRVLVRLWGMSALNAVQDHSVWYRRRCGRSVMPQLREARLAVKVLWNPIGRSAVFIVFVFIIHTSIEVCGSLVLIWATVLELQKGRVSKRRLDLARNHETRDEYIHRYIW